MTQGSIVAEVHSEEGLAEIVASLAIEQIEDMGDMSLIGGIHPERGDVIALSSAAGTCIAFFAR